jgi:hypothetical protein
LRHQNNRCAFNPFARANPIPDIPLRRHAASAFRAIRAFHRRPVSSAASGSLVPICTILAAPPSFRPPQEGCAPADGHRATRPKVERKIGHLMRRKHGGRRARVRGREKIRCDFALLAAATNLARLAVLGVC